MMDDSTKQMLLARIASQREMVAMAVATLAWTQVLFALSLAFAAAHNFRVLRKWRP